MNKKINTLKNISKKSKNFSHFLNFVWKKIISLHVLIKNSVFAIYSCTSKCEKFQDYPRIINNARESASLRIWIIGNSHNLDGE